MIFFGMRNGFVLGQVSVSSFCEHAKEASFLGHLSLIFVISSENGSAPQIIKLTSAVDRGVGKLERSSNFLFCNFLGLTITTSLLWQPIRTGKFFSISVILMIIALIIINQKLQTKKKIGNAN
jgi:hypothetical protein